MFVGHFGLALAAKRVVPRVSLGILVIAAQFLDLLWPILLLAGIEHVRIVPGITRATPLDFYDYPISHSLLTSVAWGIGLAALYWSAPRARRSSAVTVRTAIVIALLALSHWVLDWLTHRPDLPLLPDRGPKVGLGLWNSVAGTVVVESAIFFFGVWTYAKTTRASDAKGTWLFALFVLFLYGMYLGNLFGPAPPNVQAIAILSNAQWLLVAWAWWADRNREVAQ